MYWPYEYTHQGTDGRTWAAPEDKPVYPGTFKYPALQQEALAKHLAPVRDFQLAYERAFSWVNSASCAGARRGAISRDETSLFEEYGWDWAYQCVREESAWSLENANLPYQQEAPTLTPTDRLQVIQGWFGKNAH